MTEQAEPESIPEDETRQLEILIESAARRFHVVTTEEWELIPEATKKSMKDEANEFITLVYIGIGALVVHDIQRLALAPENWPEGVTPEQGEGIELVRGLLREQAELLWGNREMRTRDV